MYDANPDAHASGQELAQPMKIAFHGQAGEYFKIWIVNMVLSILTLGIYSAWAKVRTKRYFYGNTVLDGSCFEYHATPIQILKGRLIAFSLFAAIGIAGNLHPLAGLAMTFLWVFLAPWLINLSLRFNTRMSSYRNVHFDFAGTYGRSLLTFIILPILGILPAGLLLPLAHREVAHYLARNFRFGNKKFQIDLGLGNFYSYFLTMVLQSLFFGILIAGVSFVLTGAKLHPLITEYVPLLGVAAGYFFFLMLIPMYRAKIRNLSLNNLELEGGHRFASSLNPWRMGWITVSNLVVITATLGLMYPWARIRMLRYTLENTAVAPASDLSEITTALAANQRATGAELSDMMGLDIGL